MAESTDIGSFRTAHPDCDLRQLFLKNLDLMDGNGSCCPLHFFSFPRQLIQLLSIHLQGRIHGWNLQLIPLKRENDLSDLFLCHSDRMLFQYRSCQVLCICHYSKLKYSHIFFGFICQHITELCC